MRQKNLVKPEMLYRHTAIVALACFILLGCAGIQSQSRTLTVPEIKPGVLVGFLPKESLPNSLRLLAAPPAGGSLAFDLDRQTAKDARLLKDTARWRLAIEDANLEFPGAQDAFSCAVNAPITQKDTPRLYILLWRVRTDAGLSTYAAKNFYNRTRPFVVNGETSCKPADEKHLAKNGSYPSGHTSVGWAWALILAEIAPDRTDPILERGRAFGESRVVCGVHWLSDVNAGFIMGASAVARLHADPAFRAELEAAKAELAAVRAKGLPPTRDCSAERAALSVRLFPGGPASGTAPEK